MPEDTPGFHGAESKIDGCPSEDEIVPQQQLDVRGRSAVGSKVSKRKRDVSWSPNGTDLDRPSSKFRSDLMSRWDQQPVRRKGPDSRSRHQNGPAIESRFEGPRQVPSQDVLSGEVGDIAHFITLTDDIPFNVTGHFCDVFIGTHSELGKVALKRPRVGTKKSTQDSVRVSSLHR